MPQRRQVSAEESSRCRVARRADDCSRGVRRGEARARGMCAPRQSVSYVRSAARGVFADVAHHGRRPQWEPRLRLSPRVGSARPSVICLPLLKIGAVDELLE
jgi:hypothetical protein